jgi:hypothetical protein
MAEMVAEDGPQQVLDHKDTTVALVLRVIFLLVVVVQLLLVRATLLALAIWATAVQANIPLLDQAIAKVAVVAVVVPVLVTKEK